jgi:thiamine biosynthesis lipoprotein
MPDEETPARRSFRAMNSDIELVAYGVSAERRLSRAERWLAAYEDRYSRFRLLSELSRLNASAGRPFHASGGLFALVSLSLDYARRSGGLFDPTVLKQLLAAGYDRSFELLSGSSVRGAQRPVTKGDWRDVELDPATRTILLPEETGIDLGGIGKGWAVDRMASMLGRPSMVNGGGDIYLSGAPVGEDAWRVGVADPFHPEQDLAVLKVVDRGVATSSSLKRRWQSSNLVQHHLIDPRTGRPSDSDAVQVTVVAPNGVLADFHAKVALLHGAAKGVAYLNEESEVDGIVVRQDGVVLQTDGLAAYL